MHTIEHVLRRRDLVAVKPDASVLTVSKLMTAAHVGAVAVVEDDQLVGVFSERDLLTRVVAPELDAANTRVGDVMTGDVITSAIDESREASLQKMQRAGCRHLPIMVQGRAISMLSMRDLLRDEIDEKQEEIRSLREYLHQQPL